MLRLRLLPPVAIAVALAALVLAASSGAGPTMSRDSAVLHVAWDYWNKYAPGNVADIQATCDPDSVRIAWVDYYPAGGIAGAGVDGCRGGSPTIQIVNTMVPADFLYLCRVVTHEYGHLIGFLHSKDSKNIMSSSEPWGPVPSAATKRRAVSMCRHATYS